MTRRETCLHSGAGKETLPALDDAPPIRGFSYSLEITSPWQSKANFPPDGEARIRQ
jgi:hypothetical protein